MTKVEHFHALFLNVTPDRHSSGPHALMEDPIFPLITESATPGVTWKGESIPSSKPFTKIARASTATVAGRHTDITMHIYVCIFMYIYTYMTTQQCENMKTLV